ncbi:zinc finger protein 609-like [Stigmatopora argus]
MSLGGPAGGKGVDPGAVDAYDSGDEWDIGVGNLIIDLDADLEKDKLEMSGSKEGVGAPPGAVAALPDNIKFVSPVQAKEGKSKSKRSKNSKEGVVKVAPDGPKKDPAAQTHNPAKGAAGGGGDKSAKASRCLPAAVKKDKDGAPAKTKKEKTEAETPPRSGAPAEGQQNPESGAEHLAHAAPEPPGGGRPVAEEEEDEDEEMDNGECCNLKKILCGDKMESPGPTPAPPASGGDISSACEQIMVRTRSVAVNTADAAQATEPECLGPCEPGTSVNLEGIVWQETEDGMLVVNVTWRNKTYVGTLLDCTRHDWAPPRFCDSPTSDVEMRGGRGRGKRVRPGGGAGVPAADNGASSDGRGGGKTRGGGANGKGRRGSQTGGGGGGEDAKASPSSAKRKSKPASDMEPTSSSEDSKASKRMRSNSTGAGHTPPERSCPSPVLIDCPHPNCNKKYKHVNGLKYHQARAHQEHDADKYPTAPGHHEHDADSEYGDEGGPQPDAASCNGGPSAVSPARSATPKGRVSEAPSPAASKHGKRHEPDATDGECLTDETSNDGADDRKAKKTAGGKTDKLPPKGAKAGRPPVAATAAAPPAPCPDPRAASPGQAPPKSKSGGGGGGGGGEAAAKDKKKKDKKRRDCDSPKGARQEEGYAEAGDAPLNGSSEAQQNRLASIKAVADKVYSFSDHAPSPSLGARAEGAPGQNGGDGGASGQTGSPAYSDISEAGEDGEGKAPKAEPDAKKALFSPRAPPAKDAPYYPDYEAYYPGDYARGEAAAAAKKEEAEDEEEEEPEAAGEAETRGEPREAEPGPPQPSVIQQRPNVYAPPPLYYNQYYGQPYSYSPEQAYHGHLLASSPAYRQQCEERQRQDKKAVAAAVAEGKAPGPPALKAKVEAEPPAKSVIMVKCEEPKAQASQASQPSEGLKMKLSEAGHHAKDAVAAATAAVWYRQEPESRPWPSYAYPGKYPEDERDRKWKEERLRPKEAGPQKEEALPEEAPRGGKEARPPHVAFSSPLAQHQGYVPYVHGPYAYGQAYEAGHPGYRGAPSVMMQNYPGSYLPAGYSFSPYAAGKAAGAAEEGEKMAAAARSSPTVKGGAAAAATTGEAKALELLQQHASHYKSSKSPSGPPDKERDGERPPRSSPSQRGTAAAAAAHHLHHHHHLAYPLLAAAQYDLSYAAGLSSSALVAGQQTSAPSMYPPPRR